MSNFYDTENRCFINTEFKVLSLDERMTEAITEYELLAQDIATALSRLSTASTEQKATAIRMMNRRFFANDVLSNLEFILTIG